MNPLTALKQHLAERFAKSGRVQKIVLAQLEENPKKLAKLGAKPGVFEQILEGAAQSESALTRIIDSPAVLGRIMRSPKVFEKLLAAVAGNPESMYRMLSQRNMRKKMSAQNTFLSTIGLEKVALAKVLNGVPSVERAGAIKVLTGDNPDFLRELGDSPEQMAAALLYRTTGSVDNVAQMNAADRIILDGVIDTLEGQAADVILEMVQSNPDLFAEGPLRDQAIRSIVSDADSMSKLCTLYVVNPKNGPSLGVRAHKLLSAVLSEPVFVQAMIQSDKLRLSVLHIVEDSAEAAGHTVPEMLARKRTSGTKST